MAALHSADQEQLHKLLLGQLSTADVERLATEYADDGRLAELAESLAGKDDALLALLHNHETAVVDPDGERLVERLLGRLKPAFPDKPREDTLAMNKADASTEPSSPDLTGKPLPLPERLEYYRPIKVLGQGGMGTVYLAEDTRLGREVAIKTLRPELAINPQAKERFLREARTAAKLEHDNVIPIYSVGEADGTPFLAMPLLKGEPLDALIRRTGGPLPLATVVRLAREVASGLAAAHARGLIHRDIKPANIWLESRNEESAKGLGVRDSGLEKTSAPSVPAACFPTPNPQSQTPPRVKILDFGLAKAAESGNDADSETHLTTSGAIVGTPAYMAPEQASGDTVDGRADLFSLGCVMYELLTGKRAFSGPNTMSILMSLANHTPTAPDKLSTQCPAALSQLVMQLLEKDPANRPASADAVIQALDNLKVDSVMASRAASAPGHSTDVTADRGLTPAGSPTIIEHTQANTPRPSEVEVTLPSTAIASVRRRTPPKSRVAVGLAGALLLLLAAVVYRIQTDQGTLVVTIDDPAVQAILEKDGLVIRDKHSDRTWTIKATETKPLPSGKYRVDEKPNLQLLVTDDNGAEIKTDEFTLKRKGERRVRVVLEQPPILAGQTSNKNKPVVGTNWHGWPVDTPKPAIAPFDAAQAKKHQEEWAAYLKVPVEYTNSIGMKFRLIPPSEFMMGSSPDEVEAALKEVGEDHGWRACIQSEAQQHKVILTQPVYVGVTEVTQTQYEQVMGTNPSHFSANGAGKHAVAGLDTSNHPVEQLTWNDAAEFCARLSQKEMLKPFYLRRESTVTPLEGNGYRLPTEAEWEATCRAGTTTRFWSGDLDGDLLQAGWFGSNSGGRTHAVGELRSNSFGFSDMSGNVWEWVQDNWDPAFYGRVIGNAAVNPSHSFSASNQRVLRGGVWLYGAFACRSSHRFASDPRHRHYNIGFRVALPVDAVRQASNVTGPTMSKSAATTPSAPVSDSNSDRRAAEYVLSIGGTVDVRLEGNKTGTSGIRGIREVAKLPIGPFQLLTVGLQSNRQVTDAAMAIFQGCTNLESLHLDGTAIGDAGLAHFQNCKNLKSLNLSDCKRLTDAGLQHFRECKNLEVLMVYLTAVGDQGLANFQGCTNLIGLVIDATQATDQGLACFAHCKKLRELKVGGQNVTDAGLANFQGCRELRTLVISKSPQVTDAGLAHFQDCPQINQLTLVGTQVTDDGLGLLKKCQELQKLWITESNLTGAGLAHFQGHQKLTELELRNNPITDAELTHLAGCTNLQRLGLSGTKITNAGLAHLAALTKLKSVTLERNPQITAAALGHFRASPDMETFWLDRCPINDADVPLFKDWKKLNDLRLTGTNLTDASVEHLGELKSLTNLEVDDTKITAAGVNRLKQELPRCRITWAGGVIEPSNSTKPK